MWIFSYVHPHSDLIDGHTAATTAANQVVWSRRLKPNRGSTPKKIVSLLLSLASSKYFPVSAHGCMYVISAHETLEEVMTIFCEEVKR
jgi:hypothetical protein